MTRRNLSTFQTNYIGNNYLLEHCLLPLPLHQAHTPLTMYSGYDLDAHLVH